MLQIINITKSYGAPSDGNARRVLDGLSLNIEKGESLALLGPSGSGKTTLLNLIGAMDHPDSGSVIFNGRDISGISGRELDHFRNREIGFVFQFHHLLPQCTLLENVLIPTLVETNKQERKQKAQEAEALLRQVGIWEHKDKLPGKLSGGECQRAAVVRAMINQPSMLLADEPTGALDSKNVGAMADLLLEMNQEHNITLMVVTHSEELASRMGRTHQLLDGKIVT